MIIYIIDCDDNDFLLKTKNNISTKFFNGSYTQNVGPFVFSRPNYHYQKYSNPNLKSVAPSGNSNNQEQAKVSPEFFVIRIDDAKEETTFSYDDGNGALTKGLYAKEDENNNPINSNFWTPNNTSVKPKLKIYNYVYEGYVISPYNFMSAFTTDYLRATCNINGNRRAMYVNDPDRGAKIVNNIRVGTEAIQINSPFYSPTHSLKDGWE